MSLRLLIFALMIILLSGCEGLQRKFVRQPKQKQKPIPVVQTVDYSKDLRVEELYKKHFLFWKSWHNELIDRLEENYKKRISCFDSLISSLKSMRKYLSEEKAAEIDPFISQIEALEPEIKQERLSTSEAYRIRTTLEKTRRQIDKRFSYRDVKDFLRFNPD